MSLTLKDRFAIGIAGTAAVVLFSLPGPIHHSQRIPNGSAPRATQHALAVHRARVRHSERLRAAEGLISRVVTVGARVSLCEEGLRWHYVGSVYDGGLGFLLATWQQFKRPADPYWMHDASPYEQSRALFALVSHYGIEMPDQSGCSGGY